jgi:hypothetical protein
MAKIAASAPDWDLEAERELWRSICAPNSWHEEDGTSVGTHPYSYYYFLKKAWGAESYLKSHPAEPQWLYDPIHKPYTSWLQKHLLAWKRASLTGKPGRYHIASVLPRGYGKTVTSTKCAPLWTTLDDCDMTILMQSATGKLSEDILASQIAVMNGDDEDSWFVWLYGNWIQGAKEKSKSAIKHAYRRAGNISEPSIDISSANVGATGYHPRQNWWDDPLEKNKLRQDRDAYLRAQHDGVNASYNSLHVNGLMALTLTRYLDDDIAGRHFRNEGIKTWEGMECPHMALFDRVAFGKGIWHVFFYQTEDELTGEPTHPGMWTRETIEQAKARDPEDFACQHQNNPGSGERAPLVESQIPYLYLGYHDFLWDVQIKWATIHIDTAFKNKDNIGRGDDSAIVVWLADARNNGVLYLDTDLLVASNEWREEDFNKELVKVCLNLRRRGIFIRAITDETEPGGKEGTYKNRVLGILRTSGFQMGEEQFIQLNRTANKKARIRTGAGHWAEGYARILLNKSACDCPPPHYDPILKREVTVRCPHFIVPQVVKKMIYQIVKVDTTQHDDLADAATDGFARQLWTPPDSNPGIPSEGAEVRRPGDDELKSFGRPMTNEEIFALIDERNELRDAGYDDGIRGWGDDDESVLPREPV